MNNVILTTPSVGSQRFFFISTRCEIVCFTTNRRQKFNHKSQVAFIESTQLCNFPQSCAGNVIMTKSQSADEWVLCIIQNLFPLEEEPFINVFCWCGGVSFYGVPSFATVPRNHWEDIESDFCYQKFLLSQIELVFVNQVLRPSIRLESICLTKTNTVDGGVQCSRYGPYIFTPSVPKSWSKHNSKSLSLKSVPIEKSFLPKTLPITFIKNSSRKFKWTQWKSKHEDLIPNTVQKWMQLPKWIKKKSLNGSFLVVTDQFDKPLTKDLCIHLGNHLQEKFMVPNLSCFFDSTIMKQSFHALSNNNRRLLISTFQNGVDMKDFNLMVHKVCRPHPQPSYISTKKIDNKLKDDCNYN